MASAPAPQYDRQYPQGREYESGPIPFGAPPSQYAAAPPPQYGYATGPPPQYAAAPPPQYGYATAPPPQYPPPQYGYAAAPPPQYGAAPQHGYAASTPPPQFPQGPAGWQTDLCGCFEDVGNCCITCWLPCVTFGQVAEIADSGHTSCLVNGLIYLAAAMVGVPCFVSCIYRSKLRAKFNLPEDPCNDFCVHCCCDPCAICQEYRELTRRGIDPSLGWSGNAYKFSTPTQVAPQAPVMYK